MFVRKRFVSTLATVAVTAALAVAPGLLQSANARVASPARASVTAECAQAQTGLALARSAQADAQHRVVKARKALRKARHTHRAAAIRKAKRHLRHAKARYAARTHEVHVQEARVGYACSAPNSSARAAGTGMQLGLLSVVTGAAGKVMDLSQLTTLLESLLPGVTSQLDAGQLNGLLSGFNAGAPSLDDLTVLLGSVFSPEQLAALLGGSADPTVVLALVEHVIEELSGLSGVPVPGTLDTTALQGILGTVTGLLGGLPAGTGGGGGGGPLCTLLGIGC
ncbi:hypothetical protein ACVW00_003792 [Marmoricola sp. URHA0025 HA25]